LRSDNEKKYNWDTANLDNEDINRKRKNTYITIIIIRIKKT
jgi:hypothetical protein